MVAETQLGHSKCQLIMRHYHKLDVKAKLQLTGSNDFELVDTNQTKIKLVFLSMYLMHLVARLDCF